MNLIISPVFLLSFVVFAACKTGIANTSTYYMPKASSDCKNGEVCAKFKEKVKVQGSGILGTGKIYKYITAGVFKNAKGEVIREIPSHFETKNYNDCTTVKVQEKHCLIPYISVAADLAQHYTRGDIISMPSLKGKQMLMPDGQKFTHPGYLIIQDSGQGIKGKGRFDIFTYSLHNEDPKNSIGSHSENPYCDPQDCNDRNSYTVIKIKKNVRDISKQSVAYQEAFAKIQALKYLVDPTLRNNKSEPSRKLKTGSRS